MNAAAYVAAAHAVPSTAANNSRHIAPPSPRALTIPDRRAGAKGLAWRQAVAGDAGSRRSGRRRWLNPCLAGAAEALPQLADLFPQLLYLSLQVDEHLPQPADLVLGDQPGPPVGRGVDDEADEHRP